MGDWVDERETGLMSGRLWIDERETMGCPPLMRGRLWVDEWQTVG